MESNETRITERAENKAISDSVKEKKQRISVYLPPDMVELVSILYQHDDCRSKTEFVEKAVRFYCGYLMSSEPVVTDFLAPQLMQMTEGIVSGSEQKLSRAMFKIAVELGMITHLIAAENDLSEQTMSQLRAMCTEEIRRLNGIINMEKAMRYQHS